MSLINFHRLLIATAVLFCAGFALWEVNAYLEGGGVDELLIALAFAVGAGALGYYLRHLSRFLRLPGEAERGSR